ncbi:MAG: hypothetical protein LBU27_07365 [Candidatus Peribacteria bacterium]|nr:hypothetical protein [Candidatus Peribacteria bacterium]
MWDTLIDNLGGIACYSCQGVAPDNATLCPEDNTELTANTNRTLVSSCGSAKCEYTCNAEYTLQNGACAKQETYTLMVYGGYDDEN